MTEINFRRCPACDNTYTNDFVVCPTDMTLLLTPVIGPTGDWYTDCRRFDVLICTTCGAAFKKRPSWKYCPKDRSNLLPSCEPREGPVLEYRFQLTRFLRHASLYDCYEGTDRETDSTVVVKIFKDNYSVDFKSVERFLKLAQPALKIRHPHLVTLLAAGLNENRSPFLIEESIEEGVSLSNELKNLDGSLPLPDLLRAFSMVARGLAHANANGVFHGALMTSSIYIEKDSGRIVNARLGDFGVAGRLFKDVEWNGPPSTETHTVDVYGDPHVLCPDFSKGGRANEQTDIYQLGALLYEAACGERLFKRPSFIQTIMAHLNEPPDEVPTFKLLPEELKTTILACLEKEPEDRFSSMGVLADRLGELADANPVLG